jgi:hypothetical protein
VSDQRIAALERELQARVAECVYLKATISELQGLLQARDNHANVIESLRTALLGIVDLSGNWKHGMEGVHLLRINDCANAALREAS